jgi:hypothetical protein
VATKKPSVLWRAGKIVRPPVAGSGVKPKARAAGGGSGVKAGLTARKSATTDSFSKRLSEHVA